MIIFLMLLFQQGPYYQRPATLEQDLQRLNEEYTQHNMDLSYWLERLRFYTEIGELRDIEPLVSRLCEQFPNQPEFLEAHMIHLSLNDKNEEAIAVGQNILIHYPNYRTAQTNLARIYLKSGRRAEGINLMLACVEQGPVRVDDWELLLQAFGFGRVPPSTIAAQMIEKCQQHPELKSLKYSLMLLYVRFGDYANARKILIENPELAAHPDLQHFLQGFPVDLPEGEAKD